jgi:hypothetical protein
MKLEKADQRLEFPDREIGLGATLVVNVHR